MAVRSLFPILRTRDLAALISFYERAFGGVVHNRFEEVYVAMTMGSGILGIGLEPEASGADQMAIWLYVDDVDAAYGAALDAGASSIEPPADMRWGERVAQVADPEGNRVYLGAGIR